MILSFNIIWTAKLIIHLRTHLFCGYFFSFLKSRDILSSVCFDLSLRSNCLFFFVFNSIADLSVSCHTESTRNRLIILFFLAKTIINLFSLPRNFFWFFEISLIDTTINFKNVINFMEFKWEILRGFIKLSSKMKSASLLNYS